MSHETKCAECGNIYSRKKFLSEGERMVRSFHHIHFSPRKNYGIIWERLHKNPHLLLYLAGRRHRNILRCAIFRQDYRFVEELINFGKSALSPELYEEWMNCRGGYTYSGCYYRYPIYAQDIDMIQLLIRLGVPFRKTSILETFPFINMPPNTNQTLEKKLFILELLLQNGANPNGHEIEDREIEYWHKEDYFTFANSIQFGILVHPDAGDIFTLLCKYDFDFDRGIEVLTNVDISTGVDDVADDVTITREEFPLFWLHMIDIRRYIDWEVKIIFPIFSKNLATVLSLYFSKKFDMNLSFIDFERYVRVMQHRLECSGFDIFDYRYGEEDYRKSFIYKMVRHYMKYIEVFILLFSRHRPFSKNCIWVSLWWDICEYL
jgi:hypothetical protein